MLGGEGNKKGKTIKRARPSFHLLSTPLPDRYEDHGENQVLAQQRHHKTRRRDNLDDQQEKHVKTNQNRDGQRNLEITESIKRRAQMDL